MARPLSDEKRNAILAAAAQVIAVAGLGAPTARVARVAAVAEGSLFTYFANKDDLLNQLYLSIKQELASAMIGHWPTESSTVQRLHIAWLNYVQWGVDQPERRTALAQLSVSDRVSKQTRSVGLEGFVEIETLLQDCMGPGFGASAAFAKEIMSSLAETTMNFMVAEPANARRIAEAGFQAFWRALAAETAADCSRVDADTLV